MSIKYYHLAKDEELPEEFCAIKDIDGEPSEYTFYAPETMNAKLRALLVDAFVEFVQPYGNADDVYEYSSRMREVGIEV